MTPIRIFLVLLWVIISIILISVLFPPDGINIGNYKLSFVSYKSFLNKPKVEYADISELIRLVEETDSILIESINEKPAIADSLFARTISEVLHQIEYSDTLNPLAVFYNKLLNNKGLIRVLHYGDSQIEGDRITGYLRQKFQERFGGSGIGLISAARLANVSLPIDFTSNGNWKRYTIFGHRDSLIQHNKYGVLGSFARFSEPNIISNKKESHNAKIALSSSAINRNRFNFKSFKLIYGNAVVPVIAELSIDKKPSDFKILQTNKDFAIIEWLVDESVNELEIEFTAQSSPDIYALCLDPEKGIVFDNIPMRGSSGTDFSKINSSQLKKMYADLNVALIIYQFGVNLAPYEKDNYDFYERWMYSQLKFLKSLRPDLPILVVGISDMSKKEGDKFITRPNIELIRNAQKKAAFRAGCAFWDMYEAMGGENSMPSWVNADPPLATFDYTHFNHRGARIISQLLYKAIMYDFENYVNKKST